MNFGIAQINTTVGDFPANRERILAAYRRLAGRGADIVVAPELAVCGYPPRDLLFKSRFVADMRATLENIATETGPTPLVLGFAEPAPHRPGKPFCNAVAWCADGKVQHTGGKRLLPTYDVFDEERYFAPAADSLVVDWGGRRIGLTICEDIWTDAALPTSQYYAIHPVKDLAGRGLDAMINISASPWHHGKGGLRQGLVSAAARELGCPVVYCNLVGGNDELIFDGRSLVCDAQGQTLAGLCAFGEEERVVHLDAQQAPSIAPSFAQEPLEDIAEALTLGLRDYAHKTGFATAILGLSGGIDSAVTAVLAARALGPDNVTGFALPSRISSAHSRSDAVALARNLGIGFDTLAVEGIVEAAETTLRPLFEGLAPDVTEENIQSRARGLLLMAISNKTRALLVTTGNKSEVAVGYCTLYGDMAGGLAVLSDVPKTTVYALARHLNKDAEIIPQNTIDKPPSAELRPDQKDEDSLPPYDILDGILEMYVEGGASSAEIIAQGYDEGTVRDVVRKVDLNEYKRKQAAPGLKITPLAFGVGRRIPIVQRYVS